MHALTIINYLNKERLVDMIINKYRNYEARNTDLTTDACGMD